MRLTSIEVKGLLARGRRETARVAGTAVFGRTLVHPPDQPVAGLSRIALSVPKRLLKRSVDRNLVKRILRESFRQHIIREAGLDTLVTLASVSNPAAKGKSAAARSWRVLAEGLFSKICATKMTATRCPDNEAINPREVF